MFDNILLGAAIGLLVLFATLITYGSIVSKDE